ncbi:MAG: hypothetical protein AAFO77_08825 [Pseudomonadota bacterium]
MRASGKHRPYRPSNGTEGDIFMAAWCERCARWNYDDPDAVCMIQLRALAHSIDDPDYPEEWQYSDGGVPICSAFTQTEPTFLPRCTETLDLFLGADDHG